MIRTEEKRVEYKQTFIGPNSIGFVWNALHGKLMTSQVQYNDSVSYKSARLPRESNWMRVIYLWVMTIDRFARSDSWLRSMRMNGNGCDNEHTQFLWNEWNALINQPSIGTRRSLFRRCYRWATNRIFFFFSQDEWVTFDIGRILAQWDSFALTFSLAWLFHSIHDGEFYSI